MRLKQKLVRFAASVARALPPVGAPAPRVRASAPRGAPPPMPPLAPSITSRDILYGSDPRNAACQAARRQAANNLRGRHRIFGSQQPHEWCESRATLVSHAHDAAWRATLLDDIGTISHRSHDLQIAPCRGFETIKRGPHHPVIAGLRKQA